MIDTVAIFAPPFLVLGLNVWLIRRGKRKEATFFAELDRLYPPPRRDVDRVA